MRLPWLHAGIGVAAFAALAVGLVIAHPRALVWAVALLGCDYAVWLGIGTHALDQRAPIVGAGLLLTAELAYDSLEPEAGPARSTVTLARAITLAIVTLAAVAAGALVVAAAAIPLSGGLGLTVLGAAAAVLVLALIARLAAEHA